MKRCPHCLFLYPDTDERCDFDQTPLEAVDDSTVAAATRPKKRSGLLIPAVIGLILIVFGVAIYFAVNHQIKKAVVAAETQSVPEPSPSPSAMPSPSPESSPSPSLSPSPSPKTAATVATAHSRATSDPVSTSGPGMGTRQGGKPVIMLASGGKIEADEAWRTKDGVWYRRNGIVTLLKTNQVKAIVTK